MKLSIRLRNDLYCVGWGVKLYSLTHSRETFNLCYATVFNTNSYSWRESQARSMTVFNTVYWSSWYGAYFLDHVIGLYLCLARLGLYMSRKYDTGGGRFPCMWKKYGISVRKLQSKSISKIAYLKVRNRPNFVKVRNFADRRFWWNWKDLKLY